MTFCSVQNGTIIVKSCDPWISRAYSYIGMRNIDLPKNICWVDSIWEFIILSKFIFIFYYLFDSADERLAKHTL